MQPTASVNVAARKQLRSCVIQFILWSVMLLFFIFGIPHFTELFEEFGIPLPAPTLGVMSLRYMFPSLVWIMIFVMFQGILIGMSLAFGLAQPENQTANRIVLYMTRTSWIIGLLVLLLMVIAITIPLIAIINGLAGNKK